MEKTAGLCIGGSQLILIKKIAEKKENGCTCHLCTPSLQKEEVDVWRFCFRNRDHSFLTKFFTGGLKMLVLFFRQDGILSLISLGWWFCFPSQQILWKISLALPSILWLFLGNYRILIIKQKQLLCCSSFPKRVFIFVWKSSTSEVDYQQSLFCLSPSRHANASARRSYTHVLPSLTLKKKRDCSQSTSKFQWP